MSQVTHVSNDKPVHPARLIKTFLMPKYGLSESDLAKILGVDVAQVRDLLDESTKITKGNVEALQHQFGDAAISLLRLQVVLDFFELHQRRPDAAERKELYAAFEPDSGAGTHLG